MFSQTEQPTGPKAGSAEQTRRSNREPMGSMELIFIGDQLCGKHVRKENRDPQATVAMLKNSSLSFGVQQRRTSHVVCVQGLQGGSSPAYLPWRAPVGSHAQGLAFGLGLDAPQI